ncbi:hypothetical protein Dimus_032707 [Dionaea muscipula]
MDMRLDFEEAHGIQGRRSLSSLSFPSWPKKHHRPGSKPNTESYQPHFSEHCLFGQSATDGDSARLPTPLAYFLQSSFTDSFKDKDGNIYYGFATIHGLWVIDGSTELPPELAPEYQLKFIDFMHAFMSVLVFAAVSLFDSNVVGCFYPDPSTEVNEVLTALPVGIGVICSTLFVVFPTTRHGIGFPVTNH